MGAVQPTGGGTEGRRIRELEWGGMDGWSNRAGGPENRTTASVISCPGCGAGSAQIWSSFSRMELKSNAVVVSGRTESVMRKPTSSRLPPPASNPFARKIHAWMVPLASSTLAITIVSSAGQMEPAWMLLASTSSRVVSYDNRISAPRRPSPSLMLTGAVNSTADMGTSRSSIWTETTGPASSTWLSICRVSNCSKPTRRRQRAIFSPFSIRRFIARTGRFRKLGK